MSNELVPYRPKLNELRSIGELMSKSNFFADSRQAAQAVAKIQYGMELGLTPGVSMVGVYVVKGRVSLAANTMATLIQKFCFSGTTVNRFKYRVRSKTNKGCTLAFYERESPTAEWEEVGVESFDEEDRKLAGLGGDNWKKYPKNMFFARCMSNGCKTYCPAVFGGHQIYTPDEIDPRAQMDEEGGYKVDGVVVQSCDVQDAEIVGPEVGEPLSLENAPENLKEVLQLILDTGTDPLKITAHYGVARLTDLDEDAIANCKTMLLAKKSVTSSEPVN